MPLDDLYNKIKVIQEFDIVEECGIIIGENSELIAEMIRSQLEEGKDSLGNEIYLITNSDKPNGVYAEMTIGLKKEFGRGLGRITERVTNYMSGNFYQSIYTKIQGPVFQQVSDVPYFNELVFQTGNGERIMELNQANLEIFSQQILIPKLQEKFSTLFNGV